MRAQDLDEAWALRLIRNIATCYLRTWRVPGTVLSTQVVALLQILQISCRLPSMSNPHGRELL